MEDRDIIKLFYERSEQAIVELSRKYSRACRQIAFNILRNEHDVEECLNDAYLKVWNTIPPSDPESLFSYVCLATRNTAIDRLRSAKATGRPPTVDSDFDEILIHLEDPNDIESTIQSKEFNNVLNLPTVGASGAVYAILLGFGMLFPNDRIFIFPLPVPIEAKYFVIGYALIEFFLGTVGSPDGVAHFAHLGGMLFGIILILIWRKKNKIDGPYNY
jgi:hypothetical protein